MVAHEEAQRHRLPRREPVLRQMPGAEIGIHVAVRIETAFAHQLERHDGRDRLADRGRLEEGIGIDRTGIARRQHAVPLGPGDAAALDHGDADAGHVIAHHARSKRRRRRAVERLERTFDLGTPRVAVCGAGGERSSRDEEGDKGEGTYAKHRQLHDG